MFSSWEINLQASQTDAFLGEKAIRGNHKRKNLSRTSSDTGYIWKKSVFSFEATLENAVFFRNLTIIKPSLHKKRSFPLRISSSKCDQIRRKLRIWSHITDLITFTEEILNGKLHFFMQCVTKSNYISNKTYNL